ncbi:MAG: alpha/beta hydrolase fold protein [uncultured bacterium]|uniref:AB hydrolase-1 domain-containing protein n=1 Tax=Candidatus Woesebacteria bacterium RIFCSPHIGHO2_12_FULL_41_24 TaxID=1802510 RepID=A0A1F8AQE3_9BACT|nr:MAG: alpha/beta hydrolase fold protein [uncultured bacterium]OGM13263.1 MAG: hypothetical protein A2W15_05050 [Candidatus Woesebacteria bacterium RBG_16_41_13]OGM30665.1 MAG: hypothetical protein A2873_00945 [Candidatus Woesebacteria bacterium RIFCSPHIGHO2_01_FULL_42_80]OGM35802.1 MAG: hypothetical protein A3D84_00825 [Candidatus Woesebacteria bacterium RIFCSPHIGHO2_02_FULL_42_20]OGM53861.1 MAG: hypothetical protein A3E44_05595 [Candidatus Woesebacteria bacterium RIFCSPHIGHO2_12_FULL_41_24]
MNKNVVLIHGWGSSTLKLDKLSMDLEELGWQVLLLPLPGFDLQPPSTVWGVKEYADYIYKESSKFFNGSHFVVFGHSFGGRVAINIGARRLPATEGIVLCATSGVSRGNKAKRFVFSTLAKSGKIILGKRPRKLFKSFLHKLSREHDYEKLEGVMKEIFKKVVAYDSLPEVKKIKVPVFIIWGDSDRMTPLADAKKLKSLIGRSKLYVFKNLGHTLPYVRPKQIAKLIDQWKI